MTDQKTQQQPKKNQQRTELKKTQQELKRTRQKLHRARQRLQKSEAEGEKNLNVIRELQQRIEKTVSFKYVFKTLLFLIAVKLNVYNFLKRQQAFLYKLYSLLATHVNSLRPPDNAPHDSESAQPIESSTLPGIFLNLFSPRLGVLYQHEPKSLNIPKHYTLTKTLDSSPVISIVTPSFNQAEFVERTVKSVLDQNYPKLEYIIQDGGSRDGTRELLEKYRNSFFHFESGKDQGQANALNIGFKYATGEIMAYLNSDDLLLPGALHCVAAFFAKHPDVDVVYGHRVLIDENGREIGRWVLPPHDDEVLLWADYVPQETLFWKRNIWDKVGGHIDESFKFAMDWDLILRFRNAGAKFARLPRFLGAFRVHQYQKTSAHILEIGQQEMGRLRRRYHGRVISQEEVDMKVRNYVIKHLFYNILYKFRLLRY